jgi:hypothetical protein
MSFELTILDPYGLPIPTGLSFELIGDGRVLAKASVENEGRVAFDATTEGIGRLGVRLDQNN